MLEWLKGNSESLERGGVQIEIVEGLTHQQEFSQIDIVHPLVVSFFGKCESALISC